LNKKLEKKFKRDEWEEEGADWGRAAHAGVASLIGGGAGTAAVRTSRILRGGGAVEDADSAAPLRKGFVLLRVLLSRSFSPINGLELFGQTPKAQSRAARRATFYSPVARRAKNCAFFLKKIDT
jgi:hypothetical protein